MALFMARRPMPMPGFFLGTIVNQVNGPHTSYLTTDGFLRPGSTNNGMRFQAQGTSVEVFYTMDDPGLATTPTAAAQNGVNWTSVGSADDGAYLTPNQLTATAVKLVFSGKGSVSCGSL